MNRNPEQFTPQQYRKYNGQSICFALSALGDIATADKLTSHIAKQIGQPEELVKPEVKNVLRRGILEGFLVRNGNTYSVPKQVNIVQTNLGKRRADIAETYDIDDVSAAPSNLSQQQQQQNEVELKRPKLMEESNLSVNDIVSTAVSPNISEQQESEVKQSEQEKAISSVVEPTNITQQQELAVEQPPQQTSNKESLCAAITELQAHLCTPNSCQEKPQTLKGTEKQQEKEPSAPINLEEIPVNDLQSPESEEKSCVSSISIYFYPEASQDKEPSSSTSDKESEDVQQHDHSLNSSDEEMKSLNSSDEEMKEEEALSDSYELESEVKPCVSLTSVYVSSTEIIQDKESFSSPSDKELELNSSDDEPEEKSLSDTSEEESGELRLSLSVRFNPKAFQDKKSFSSNSDEESEDVQQPHSLNSSDEEMKEEEALSDTSEEESEVKSCVSLTSVYVSGTESIQDKELFSSTSDKELEINSYDDEPEEEALSDTFEEESEGKLQLSLTSIRFNPKDEKSFSSTTDEESEDVQQPHSLNSSEDEQEDLLSYNFEKESVSASTEADQDNESSSSSSSEEKSEDVKQHHSLNSSEDKTEKEIFSSAEEGQENDSTSSSFQQDSDDDLSLSMSNHSEFDPPTSKPQNLLATLTIKLNSKIERK